MESEKIHILKPEDRQRNEKIVEWLIDNFEDITQLSVIAVYKNGDSRSLGSMYNFEKVWYWELHKNRLLNQKD